MNTAQKFNTDNNLILQHFNKRKFKSLKNIYGWCKLYSSLISSSFMIEKKREQSLADYKRMIEFTKELLKSVICFYT